MIKLGVAIIIVSHSNKIAEGLKELILQMAKENVKVEAVGGIGFDSKALGSDPLKIKENIMKMSSEDGIALVCDFGSTILSAKAVLKMVPEELRKKVVILDTPLVEGAFTAAIEASTGASLEEVVKSAEEARSFHKF